MNLFLKHILLLIFSLVISSGISQQIALNTQFYHFDFAVNPSLAGKKSYNPIYLSYRNQWTGFNGSPETIQFGGSYSINNKNAVGVQFFQDVHGGAYKQSGVHFNYANHLSIGANQILSVGAGILVDQFSGDFSNLELVNSVDDVFMIGQESKLLTDFNFGINYSIKNFNIGFTGTNLLQSKISDNAISNSNRLGRQYQIMSSYNFAIDSNVVLMPKMLFRAMESGTYHGDVMLLSELSNLYLLGISHRINTSWSFIAGLNFKGAIISYSYDFATSGLQSIMGSTHEIVLGYKFKKGEIRKAVKDRDFDGVVDKRDLCPDEPGPVDNEGCPEAIIDNSTEEMIQVVDSIYEPDSVLEIDSTDFEIIDSSKVEINSILETLVDTINKPIDEIEINLIFDNIEFEFDRSTVKTQFFPDLLRIVQILNQNETWHLLIEGHTDAKRNVAMAKRKLKAKGIDYSEAAHDKMSKTYNKLLSQRRTDFVLNYFVKNGIAKSRLKAIGFGEEKPIATNETESGRQINRRVEVTIIK